MKRIFILFLILISFKINLSAITCVDTGASIAEEASAAVKYAIQDGKIAAMIYAISKIFDETILNTEKQNLRETEILEKLYKNKALQEENKKFILKLQNEIQSIINNIEGQ